MKDLKNLTPAECIEIATIVEPTLNWEFVKSNEAWDGHDLMADQRYNFQIDYRSNLKPETSRFRFYKDLIEYEVTDEKIVEIYNYLKKQ